MAEPPFPVPRGMEWDPHKRRFFKAKPPAAASIGSRSSNRKHVAVQHAQTSGRISSSSVFESDAAAAAARSKARREALRTSHPLTTTTRGTWPHNSAGRSLLTLRSHAPRLSAVHASQRTFAAQELAHARFTRLATTRRPDALRPIGIHALFSNTTMGSLLHFMAWNGQVYMIDTSQMHQQGATYVELHMAELSWFAPRRAYQIGAPTPLSPTSLAFRTTMVERLLAHGSMDATPGCYAMDGEYFVTFTSPIELEISRHAASGASSQHDGRNVVVQPEKHKIKIPRAWPRDGYVTLSVRHAMDSVIVCIGAGNWVYLFRIVVQGTSSTQSASTMQRTFKRLDSDVIAHDIDATGTHVVIGCRNGRALYMTLDFHAQQSKDDTPTGGGGKTRVAEQDYMPVRAVGAVTNVKFVAADEVVMAFSSGQLICVSVLRPDVPLIEYQGHINSWTLNPPIAVDVSLRLMALAGQDRRVRVWSLDQAEPLGGGGGGGGSDASGEHDNIHGSDLVVDLTAKKTPRTGQLLHQLMFASDITGLTFCQRHAVAHDEAMQNAAFLPRGVPALAVACGGNEIAFFE